MKVVRNPVFKAPVKVMCPTEEGLVEETFTGRFRARSRSELREYDISTAEGMEQLLRDVVIGWEGLEDFGFSAENLGILLDMDPYRQGFARAYFSATSGLLAAKRGN